MVMKAVKVFAPGAADVLKIASVPIPSPGQDEVLIKVKATAINRADILQRKGLYNPPKGTTDIIGLECSGVIAQGNETWKEGTPVIGFLRGGGYAEYVNVHTSHVLPLPDGLDFIRAAAIAEVWLTGYKCLKYIGKCQPGETVLIHAAASGVGSALIQLAKHFKLKTFATCGSDEKVQHCLKLGADKTWNYKQGSFVQSLRDFGGTDLIMDSVGRNYWNDNVEVLKQQGRWVVYGFLSGSKVETDLMKIFAKHASVFFTSFRSRSDLYRGKVVAEFLNDGILDGFVEGKFDPCVFKVIRLEDVVYGHEMIEKNLTTGKVVMVVGR